MRGAASRPPVGGVFQGDGGHPSHPLIYLSPLRKQPPPLTPSLSPPECLPQPSPKCGFSRSPFAATEFSDQSKAGGVTGVFDEAINPPRSTDQSLVEIPETNRFTDIVPFLRLVRPSSVRLSASPWCLRVRLGFPGKKCIAVGSNVCLSSRDRNL